MTKPTRNGRTGYHFDDVSQKPPTDGGASYKKAGCHPLQAAVELEDDRGTKRFAEVVDRQPLSGLRDEMLRLNKRGYTLIPLGGDGKKPQLANWSKHGVKLSQCLAIMSRVGSRAYGVRLDGMVVLDVDTHGADLIAHLEDRFGVAGVHVRSPRGMHLYYAAGDAIPALKAEGLPVDVKTGPHQFVVGPQSVRPDGGVYTGVKGRLGETVLTPLRLFGSGVCTPKAGKRVAPEVGERHDCLLGKALSMVECVDTLTELVGNLDAARDDFPDPDTMPDSEVRGIAQWTWNLRLENRIFTRRDSQVRLDRRAIDALRHDCDALALYVVLFDPHGHSPGKHFSLSHSGMSQAGLIKMSRDRFRAARDTLIRVGLLRKVANHRAGVRAQQFTLCRLPSPATEVQTVIPMLPGNGEGK